MKIDIQIAQFDAKEIHFRVKTQYVGPGYWKQKI